MGIRNFNPQRMAEGLRTRVFRTKPLDSQIESEAIPMTTKFQKCLTTRDLTSLGVGSCVGTGMYVVSGLVARNMAGPGVVMSFAIAAVASLLSGESTVLVSTYDVTAAAMLDGFNMASIK
ncbi:hypothetical protein Bbelb_218260 [Branchiostoma belcheri]|nr:hypothetical protein Bbelb_218260 [Branchiostoma belcheri]